MLGPESPPTPTGHGGCASGHRPFSPLRASRLGGVPHLGELSGSRRPPQLQDGAGLSAPGQQDNLPGCGENAVWPQTRISCLPTIPLGLGWLPHFSSCLPPARPVPTPHLSPETSWLCLLLTWLPHAPPWGISPAGPGTSAPSPTPSGWAYSEGSVRTCGLSSLCKALGRKLEQMKGSEGKEGVGEGAGVAP